MDRRDFLAASAAALACTARLSADEKAADKSREPDLVIKRHRGRLAFSPDSKVLAVANGPIGEAEGFCLIDHSASHHSFDKWTCACKASLGGLDAPTRGNGYDKLYGEDGATIVKVLKMNGADMLSCGMALAV